MIWCLSSCKYFSAHFKSLPALCLVHMKCSESILVCVVLPPSLTPSPGTVFGILFFLFFKNLTCKFYLFNIKVALPSDVLPGNQFVTHWGSRSPETRITERLASRLLFHFELPPSPSDEGGCNDGSFHNFKQLFLDTLSKSVDRRPNHRKWRRNTK